ncbi:type II secretion system protein M [Luteimonas aestuarii]|uniref:Type II secretion system protein M n=1 Tax=Luteimonas aestuarii TaxID=453837 RepID=A0A4R5U4M4_9GAMM|nr:type II secretion system protein GspM [Luteimonas aestuarii]TDK28687.1 type II secretion system protein M [Luteimonas aestuarii]
MNGLHALQTWWQARDVRERRLLWLILAALAAFAWWYGMLTPLRQVRETAHASHQRAADTFAVVQAAAARLATQPGDATAPTTREAVSAAVVDAARATGVAITRDRDGEPGTWLVDIDAVDHAPLVAWLEQMRRQHGLAPDALHVTTGNGQLRVHARFLVPTPPAPGR